MFEIAVVNEPSMFEALKFYCNLFSQNVLSRQNGRIPMINQKARFRENINVILDHDQHSTSFRNIDEMSQSQCIDFRCPQEEK